MTRAMVWLLAVAIVACGGAPARLDHNAPGAIEALRARAAAAPNDPELARALAAAELLYDEGDIDRVRPALERALALAPEDPILHFLSAFEHEQRGRLPEAFASEIAAIERARTSDSTLAPAIAEVLVNYAAARESDVPEQRTLLTPVLTRLVDEPAKAGMPARMSAMSTLLRLVRRGGDAEAPRQIAARVGCIQRARVAGPFGSTPMLSFDRPVAAEARGALLDRYDLGAPHGEMPTRSLTGVCGFALGEGMDEDEGGPGVWVLESTLELPEAGRYVLRVQTTETFRVRIDGEQVAGADRRREMMAESMYVPLALSGGAHEIEIVIAAREPSPFVSLALAKSDDAFAAERGLTPPSGDDIAARLLRVLVARARGDSVGAREAVRRVVGRNPSAALLVIQADVTLSDPFLPEEERRDRARRLLESAAERDPSAWYPRYQAALADQDGRASFEKLRETAERHPTLASLQLEVGRALAERGRTAEADAYIRRARELVPTSCEALAAELASLRRRGRAQEADQRVDELLACDARSSARLALYEAQRRWDDAAREIERLAPLLENDAARDLRLDLASATGDDATVRRLREEIARARGESYIEHYPIHHVDELLAAGERGRASSVLAEAIVQRPSRSGALRRVRRALGGDDPLFRYRVDGAEAIRRFEASGRRYNGASHILVLDYMVVRLHADGSSEELVHQIYRVDSEEAIEQLGQLSLPGYVLTLRTIKPDGRRLEPDAIEGLDHAELPSLAVGDYVEYEFVRSDGPTNNGGYRSNGWVFQNFSYPFDLSRIVLVAPHDLPVVIEPRGPVPAPTEARDGDLRVLTWTVEESRPLTAEPRSAVSPERLPHLDFGVRASWDSYFDGIVDGLLDGDPRDPSATRLVRRILGRQASASIEQRARRLHRWVLANIEDGNGAGPTALQLGARAGNRNRVLRYLHELAGIDARIVLARALGERSPMQLYRDDVYPAALVMIRRPEGPPIFTSAAERGIPFGYVSPNLRGQQAIVIEPGHSTVTIGESGDDLRDVIVDASIARDGSARVSIEERFFGANSYFWRQQLEGVPEAELEQRFEQGYVVPMLGPGRLVSLAIEGRDDPDAPLVFRYVVELAALGRSASGAHLIGPFFRSELARSLASLAARETTQRVMGSHLRVRTTLRGSGGAPRTSADARLTGPGESRATRRTRIEGGALVIEQETRLRPMLVEPREYAAFAEFCRAVDRMEAQEARIPR